jgi:hypothetical protein
MDTRANLRLKQLSDFETQVWVGESHASTTISLLNRGKSGGQVQMPYRPATILQVLNLAGQQGGE